MPIFAYGGRMLTQSVTDHSYHKLSIYRLSELPTNYKCLSSENGEDQGLKKCFNFFFQKQAAFSVCNFNFASFDTPRIPKIHAILALSDAVVLLINVRMKDVLIPQHKIYAYRMSHWWHYIQIQSYTLCMYNLILQLNTGSMDVLFWITNGGTCISWTLKMISRQRLDRTFIST